MNKHQIFEMSGRIFVLAAFMSIPCLSAISYLGWLKRIRANLPFWRNVLGVGSIVLTFTNWLGFIYFALVIATDARIGAPDSLTALNVAGLVASVVAVASSFALKERPKMWAFLAACLVTPLWTLTILSGR